MYPFNPSNNKVKVPKDFFPVLRTFVAPIFPDPISLRSLLRKIFVSINPKGIEPKKYE